MYKGIYIALSGAALKQTHIDIISQNIANTNTPGYKKDKISFQEFLLSQISGNPNADDGRAMSDISAMAIDFSGGNMLKTGNQLDIAIEGNGFISLEGGRYTKRGDFNLDGEGNLVSKQGVKILGKSGPIKITGRGPIEITTGGDVIANGVLVDTLKIVEFEDINSLKKMGEDSFVTDSRGVESKAAVKQGFIETSNVEVIKEMVQMITVLREYESFQKAIHAFDESTSKVTNDMGRI